MEDPTTYDLIKDQQYIEDPGGITLPQLSEEEIEQNFKQLQTDIQDHFKGNT